MIRSSQVPLRGSSNQTCYNRPCLLWFAMSIGYNAMEVLGELHNNTTNIQKSIYNIIYALNEQTNLAPRLLFKRVFSSLIEGHYSFLLINPLV